MEKHDIRFKEVLKGNSNLIYSKHFRDQMNNRDLLEINVENALNNGNVIEYISRYNQGEKFLIYCSQENKIFHISAIYNNNTLLLKTIYLPEYPSKFMMDLKTRVSRL